jgi:hypothetical protein
MQKQDIEKSITRLQSRNDGFDPLAVIVDGGISINFTQADFDVGDGSTCVWLYQDGSAVACVDTRSIIGIRYAR